MQIFPWPLFCQALRFSQALGLSQRFPTGGPRTPGAKMRFLSVGICMLLEVLFFKRSEICESLFALLLKEYYPV